MKIDKNIIDDLNQTIVLTLEKSDVEPKFKQGLKNQAQKSQMKGFRKGKTPIGMVKKMYGQQILIDVINRSIQQELSTFLNETDLNILGQPIPSEDQEQLDFDINNISEYVLKFDIGVAPDFSINGVGEEDSFELDVVKLSDKIIDDEIEAMRARLGEQQAVEGDIEANDMIVIEADELDGKKKKKEGWSTSFTVLVDTLTEEYKKELIGKKAGDSFTFDITNIEPDKSEDYVNKYLLNKKEGDEDTVVGNDFEGVIKEVKRLIKPEFDQDAWDKIFGAEEVSSEEEARAKIAEGIQKHYDEQANQVMYGQILDVINTTEIEMPEPFLKRWLKSQNDSLTDEQIETEFPDFLKGLKWQLIRERLVKENEIEVSFEDVRNAMKGQVFNYFSQFGADPSMVESVTDQMMENKEEVNKLYDQILMGRLLESVGQKVTKVESEISSEDFIAKVKALNEKQKADK